MDQYIGKYLDSRYELLEVIGTGGMAVVYKARCHRLNRFVAVKVLKSDLAQDAEFRRRFHDESQAVAMLSHPNIVAVYDVSRSSELDYIVMELIDGITLKQYMKKKGMQLNWREALHFITQIMRALSHAHSRGIIHRDIKPHNIMVLRDGSVKVADFGIARLVSANQSTLTQEALGSVHYISPEQARGSHIDARADIYSAGVVLYEMTTGRLPFEGDSAVSVAIAHINSIPLSPRDLNPEIPEALEAITMKAMAPVVDQRYTGSDEMLADLEEFRKNPNINFDFTLADVAGQESDAPTQRVNRTPAQGAATAVQKAPAPRTKTAERRRRTEDDPFDDRPEKGGVWPVLLALGSILVFLVGISYFLWVTFFSGLFSTQTDYRVPYVLGITVEEAERLPAVLGTFTIVRGEVVESDEYPAGTIVAQQPEADKLVKNGSLTITVSISAGKEDLRMPDVRNWEQRVALALLQDNMGLQVQQEEAFSDTIIMGHVISSTPEADDPILPGDEVVLVVSRGPEIRKTMVPAFVGASLEIVKPQLPALELELGSVKEVASDTQSAGVIVYQSIEQGTEVPVGSKIDFEVSTGPEETPAASEHPDTTPTTSPEPTASTSPEPTPTNTTPVVVTTTKTIPVDMPDREGIVLVQITVDGVEHFKAPVDCSIAPTINPRVSGSGVQEICIYLDGVLVKQYNLDFSS